MLRKSSLQVLALAGLILVFTPRDKAQMTGPHALITQAIDENRRLFQPGGADDPPRVRVHQTRRPVLKTNRQAFLVQGQK